MTPAATGRYDRFRRGASPHVHPVDRGVTLQPKLHAEGTGSEPDTWLQQCPVDIDGRFVSAIALTKLSRKDEASEQLRWYRGLIDDILSSGDGHAPASAFVVISVPEEYAVLRAFRLQRKSQSLIDGGIDALIATDADGRETTIYFNPAAHFRRLNRLFGESSPGAKGSPNRQ